MKLGLLLGFAPLAAGGLAHAQTVPVSTEATSYISVSGGSISGTDYSYSVEDAFPVRAEMGDGYVFEAAYGMVFPDNWRGEVSLSWRDHNNATTTWQFGANLTGPGVSAYTLDAIGYRDFPFSQNVSAYLGAGLGIASVTVDDGVISDSTGLGLQIQALAGIEARISKTIIVFAEARYRSLHPSIETGTAGVSGGTEDDIDISTTSVQAGFKFLL